MDAIQTTAKTYASVIATCSECGAKDANVVWDVGTGRPPRLKCGHPPKLKLIPNPDIPR